MRWPWTVDRTLTDQAGAARSAARRRLREARSRAPEVRELAEWSRKRREANHLTELFQKIVTPEEGP